MRSVATLLLALVLVGCGTEVAVPTATDEPSRSSGTESASTAPDPEREATGDLVSPPPVTLHAPGGDVRLKAWAYCWSGERTGVCADGIPSEDPASVGDPDEVEFTFPVDGWTFEATFREPDKECGRSITVPVEKVGDQRFRVSPAGPPSTWHVDLFGRGPGGDVITTFAWTTTEDGTMPEPDGYLALLASHDGALDSYGIELAVNDLAETPAHASAVVTVTASGGESLTFDPLAPEGGCHEQGGLFFRAPDSVGRQAVGLGEAPFRYEVVLEMDGTMYTGRATWPDDVLPDYAPNTGLTWDPPLPEYRG